MVVNWFRRHWRINLIACLVVVGLAIWITATSEHFVSTFIIKFLVTWSPAFGAAALVLLAIATVAEISESRQARIMSRKERALHSLYNWAFASKAAVLLLDIGEKEIIDEMNVVAKLATSLTQGNALSTSDGDFSIELQLARTEALTHLRQSIDAFRNDNDRVTLTSVMSEVSDSFTKIMVLVSLERSKS